jgi:23S rRNA maturation mini-RNase III
MEMTTKEEEERICRRGRKQNKKKDVAVMDEEPYTIHTSKV